MITDVFDLPMVLKTAYCPLRADSDDVGWAFRLMSATCSDQSRPAVPIDVGRGGGAPAGWM